jgi:hypothetical protein
MDLDWVNLAQHRPMCQDVVNKIMNFWIPQKEGCSWLAGGLLVSQEKLCFIKLAGETIYIYIYIYSLPNRAQWPHNLRRRSAAARLLRCEIESRRTNGCLSVVSVVRCQVEVSATSSSSGTLPTVVRCCLWYGNLKNEETRACGGPQRHRKKI